MSLRHQPSLIPAVHVILISFLSQVTPAPRVLPGFFHLLDDEGKYLYTHGPLKQGSPSPFPFGCVLLTTDGDKDDDKAKFKFGEPDEGVRQLFVYLNEDRG